MTTATVKEILAHYDAGKNYTEIARALGLSVKTVWRWCHEYDRPARPQMTGNRPQKLYYVYLRATDQLVAVGSARECADRMGINLLSFYSAVSRTNQGKNKKYEFYQEEMPFDD